MKTYLPLWLALVGATLAGLVSCASILPDTSCGRAHANYLELVKANYECEAAVDCLRSPEDLRRLNHAESEVVALCANEKLP